MSGGHFNYLQYNVSQLADDIKAESIKYSSDSDDNEEYKWKKFPDEILKEMKSLSRDLERNYERVHNLDWFLSGDYGEDTYLKCIKENI